MHMHWTRFKRYDISSFDAPCSDYDVPTPFFMCRPLLFPLITIIFHCFLLLYHHMVVPSRELVNTYNFSFSQPTNNMSNNSNSHQDPSPMDIEDFTPRGWSLGPNKNCQRSQSIKSGTSSMDYAKRMQAQNNQSWVKDNKQSIPSQVDTPCANNKANLPTSIPHGNGIM